MKRLLLVAFFALPSFLSAESYVTPVATARVKDRLYSTTTSFTNGGSLDVSCEAIYGIPNGGTLRAEYEIAAGRTIVEEDTLIEAGAIGTMRVVCTGPAVIAARIQTSTDGGTTFDDGRIFLAASEADAIAEGTTTSVRTTTDLLVMEIAGRRTPFDITVRDRLGATVGAKKYDLRPFAQEVINLSKILPAAATVTVEIKVAKDAGSVVVSRPTTDARFVAMTERRPRTPRLVTASFKAAPFRDPATGLVYMRDRWYDPSTGSFLTPDPEGFADSANPYAYCGGDPVNCSDPTGRAASLSRSGWILATDNRNGRRIRRFSPEDIAKDPTGVRRFLGLRAEISAAEADDIMFRAGYGAWFGNQGGISAAAIGAARAKPVVEATATGLSLMGSVTTVGGIAQVTQALLDTGPNKTNLTMAGLAVLGLGATDDIIRLGNLADVPEIFGIVPYRPNLRGVEQHHGVLDVWAAANIPGYISRGTTTPTIILTATQHAATKQVYREWLFARTGKKVGGRVDWTSVSPAEIQELAERMFDAAGVPPAARQEYYRAFHQYMYGR